MKREVFADKELARRLERAEATANAQFVEARARLQPACGATWIEVCGAYAMYDGVRSPCTQSFGLGLFGMPSAEEMERLESFFRERGAPVLHEVCPLAERELFPMLGQRGYRIVEFSSVLFMPLDEIAGAGPVGDGLRVRIAGEDERELWAQTGAAGWSEHAEFADVILDLLRVSASRENGVRFLVELDGRAIAAGGLLLEDGVALLAGASTVPEWRHRGAQRLLLRRRLQYARDAGCDLATMSAEPGGGSQRNAERSGFRLAYTRVKFGL